VNAVGLREQWDEALAGFSAALEQQDLAVNTRLAYQAWAAAAARRAVAEGLALADVTPSALARWRDTMLAEGRTPGAVGGALLGAVKLLRWATAQGLTPEWPPAVRPPRLPRAQSLAPRWLSDRDTDRLLRVARTSPNPVRDFALVALMVMAGLRVSEALHLRPQDLTLRGDAGSWATVLGKGKKTRRVPLPAPCRDALLALERQVGAKSEWLFPGSGRRGGPLTRAAAHKLLQRLSRRAGIEPVSAHRLRHTAAHRLLSRGAGLERVAAILGHTSLDTTRLYVAPSAEELTLAAKRAWE